MNLIKGIKALVIDVKEFRHNFETKGPTVAGLEPREALNRLRMFSDEYSIRKRKFDSYFSGETLFGLPHTQYPLLVKTASEIELLISSTPFTARSKTPLLNGVKFHGQKSSTKSIRWLRQSTSSVVIVPNFQVFSSLGKLTKSLSKKLMT